MPMLIDSHCHFDLSDFDHDRDIVWQQCQNLGITRLIVPAIHARGWPKLLQICQQYPSCYPALGLHPLFITQHQLSELTRLENYLSEHSEIIAIGEIGLDFYIPTLDQTQQLKLFSAQLTIAQQARLPVIIHARKSHEQILQQLKQHQLSGGLIHAFNGSLEQAKRYIDLGYKLGLGGTLTYPGARKIHTLARQLPLESIVLETDAPDMPIYSQQRQRNSPEHLLTIAETLANIREISVEDVAHQTFANIKAVFPQGDCIKTKLIL